MLVSRGSIVSRALESEDVYLISNAREVPLEPEGKFLPQLEDRKSSLHDLVGAEQSLAFVSRKNLKRFLRSS